MSDFTYELPDNESFLTAVRSVAVNKFSTCFDQVHLYDVIKEGTCEIYDTQQYSKQRWDAMGVKMHFYVPTQAYGLYNRDQGRLNQELYSYM